MKTKIFHYFPFKLALILLFNSCYYQNDVLNHVVLKVFKEKKIDEKYFALSLKEKQKFFSSFAQQIKNFPIKSIVDGKDFSYEVISSTILGLEHLPQKNQYQYHYQFFTKMSYQGKGSICQKKFSFFKNRCIELYSEKIFYYFSPLHVSFKCMKKIDQQYWRSENCQITKIFFDTSAITHKKG